LRKDFLALGLAITLLLVFLFYGSGGSYPTLLSPENDASVNLTPTLEWQSYAGATSYDVFVTNPPTEEKSLISWWPLNGTAEDYANSNDGTVYGATSTSGKYGNAYSFDGSDYIQIQPTPSLYGMDELTLCAWINLGTIVNQGAIITRWGGTGATLTYSLYINNVGKMVFLVGNGTTNVSTVTEGIIPISSWYFIVGRYDGSEIRLWINGVAESNHNTFSGKLNSEGTTPIKIGANSWNSEFYGFIGVIDEVRIYARALDNAEIQYLYQNPPPSVINDNTVENTYSLSLSEGTYGWQVRGVFDNGDLTEWSDMWVFNASPMSAPVLSSPAENKIFTSPASPTFSWEPVYGAVSYDIEIQDNSLNTIYSVQTSLTSYSLPADNALDVGDYYWRVRGVASGNAPGPWSELRSFSVVLPTPSPLTITENDTSFKSTETIILSWAEVENADGYEVQIADYDDTNYTNVLWSAEATTNSVTIPAGELPSGDYRWRVRAWREV